MKLKPIDYDSTQELYQLYIKCFYIGEVSVSRKIDLEMTVFIADYLLNSIEVEQGIFYETTTIVY